MTLKHTPYIQHFVGPYTESAGATYSRSNTFWLGQLILPGAAIAGIFLDSLFKFPVMVGIVLAVILGCSLGEVFIKIMLTNSLGEREYRQLTQAEIKRAISNSKAFWIMLLVEGILVSGIVFVSLISLSENTFKGKDFVMFIVGTFGTVALHNSIYPHRGLKARKILKKQLKEGKYND
ncbi:hypothetical protein [Lactovum odontotermitis]